MGERLVINFYENGKRLCNSYFHWDGYTFSIVDNVEKAICFFNESKCKIKDVSTRYHALEAFRRIGCCRNLDAVLAMTKENKKASEFEWLGLNRNHGLVEITEYGMKDSSSWAEHEVDIHVDKKEIVFDNLLYKVGEDEDDQECFEEDIKSCLEIDEIIEDINKVSYAEFYQLSQLLKLHSAVKFGGEPYVRIE